MAVRIHIAHDVGCLFHHPESEDEEYVIASQLEAVYFQLALDVLSSDSPLLSPLDEVQAYTIIGTYLHLKRHFNDGWGMLSKANEVVLKYGMHITIPPSPSAVASASSIRGRDIAHMYGHLMASDDADEESSILCHLLGIQLVSDMMLEMPVGVVPWLEDELGGLTRMDPPLDPTNIIIMRTIGIRLLHETRTFISQWAQIAQSAPTPGCPPLWYPTYTSLILRIYDYITRTKLSTTHFSLILSNRVGVLSMQTSTLLGLTGLINMHSMLANAFPEVRAGAREQAVSAAVDIASISEGFGQGDYEYLDGTLSLVWNVALEVLEQERIRVSVLSAHHNRTGSHQNPSTSSNSWLPTRTSNTLVGLGLGVHAPNLPALCALLRQCMRRIRGTPPFVYHYILGRVGMEEEEEKEGMVMVARDEDDWYASVAMQ